MKKRGFTLVELLATISILALIAVIAVPSIWGIVQDSKEKSQEHQLEELYKAVDLYTTDRAISLDIDEYAFISVGELFTESYINSVPKDAVTGKRMDGVVKITGTATSNRYEYVDVADISDPSILKLNGETPSTITISGISQNAKSNLFETLATQVAGKGNSENKKIDGKESLVVDSNDIDSVRHEWFLNTFTPNTAYTLSIMSKPITPVSQDSKYHINVQFNYIDGTTSEACEIAISSDTDFTEHTCTSDASKSIRSVSFVTGEESHHLYGFIKDSFKITPDAVPAPNYSRKITSLAEERYLEVKAVMEDGSYVERRVGLTAPIRSLGTIKDNLLIQSDGSFVVKRKIGKITLNRNNVHLSNVSLVPGSESANGYHTFQITGVLSDHLSSNTEIMSNTFPSVSNNWQSSVNQIGIAVDSNNVMLKVLKTEMPDVNTLIQFLESHPVDVYYTLNEEQTENISTERLDLSQVQYLYVGSNLNPEITQN